jgi:hypothetical protein
MPHVQIDRTFTHRVGIVDAESFGGSCHWEMDLSSLKGKKVFMDVKYFESVDKAYVLGALREKLGKDGAILLASEDEAEYIVEPRNRGLGLDTRSSLFGLPAMDIPIPLAGRISSPELALYKAQKADGIASFVSGRLSEIGWARS